MSVTIQETNTVVPISEVIFREDLYPRIKTSPETVQKYADDLSVLPPIEVNQRYEIIDGWHRWTAHRQVGVDEIAVIVTHTATDADFLELAIERNATHGLQLSQEDKRDMARRIYHATPERERETKKKVLSRILSVSDRTVREWLSRIDKDAKEARDRRIFAQWLACSTQEEIAEREVISVQPVKDVIADFLASLPENLKAAANHATDFEPPLYNVWKQQEKSESTKHFGNTESRWLDNLLYLYTEPFEIVIDPFAGGGSTIDICRKRFRRYLVSDRKPKVARESEIRRHDIRIDGLPKPPQWRDVRLVYLDPPYWKQAEGEYSTDPEDLANMPLEQFTDTLVGLIRNFSKKLTSAYIALIMSPTQWPAEERAYTDHVIDIARLVKLPIDMRFSCPYESQQYNGNQVRWAKENRKCLVLSREIIIWRVG
jgi:ParB-like chromosome segregation protein Spo0J